MRSIELLIAVVCAGLLTGSSCAPDPAALLPEDNSSVQNPGGVELVARLVHLTDTHIVDTESPARWAGAQGLTRSAWRPWEAYSTQMLDGLVRTANRIHASGSRIDFLIHTGDCCDNVQTNELHWFLDVMDGAVVNPLSGPDDRAPEDRPPPLLDPYATFVPQGLYRTGVHGDQPSIPWYGLIGNHDTFAIGVFPIITTHDGSRVAPLPLSGRPGLLLPVVFDPTGSIAHGNVTPADPGPPPLLDCPSYVPPVPERAYFSKDELVAAFFNTPTGPPGHGFAEAKGGATWYSLTPAPGLRLIGLDTAAQVNPPPGCPEQQGCITQDEVDFLRSELDAAQARGELVIVATHHPSRSLELLNGSALGPDDFRTLLNGYPNVVLHLAGHNHVNRVTERGGYVEIETCSTIDPPQEGRVVELWRSPADGSVLLTYHMFSYLDDSLPPLGDDPLRPLREQAHAISNGSGPDATQQMRTIAADDNPRGDPADREGAILLKR